MSRPAEANSLDWSAKDNTISRAATLWRELITAFITFIIKDLENAIFAVNWRMEVCQSNSKTARGQPGHTPFNVMNGSQQPRILRRVFGPTLFTCPGRRSEIFLCRHVKSLNFFWIFLHLWHYYKKKTFFIRYFWPLGTERKRIFLLVTSVHQIIREWTGEEVESNGKSIQRRDDKLSA